MIQGKLYRFKVGSNTPLFNENDVIVSRVNTGDILIYISTEEKPSQNNTFIKVIHQDVVGCFKFIGAWRESSDFTWFQEVVE